MSDTYTHGHHESVLRSHSWRTAANSCGYFLEHLQPGHRLLDVGCGPGTISLDLGALVAPGGVVGVDANADVIAKAEAARLAAGAVNVSFSTGDVYSIGFDDGSFDVVHAHQLLQHLTEPVTALREMRRVLRRGGLLAVRDSDYAAFAWAPIDPMLDRWMELYHQVTVRNRAEADAGRYLLGWVRAAGYTDITAGSSTWTFADPASRSWWGGLWAERVMKSTLAEQALAYELSDKAELEAIASAWHRWAAHPDGFFAVLHGEVVARR